MHILDDKKVFLTTKRTPSRTIRRGQRRAMHVAVSGLYICTVKQTTAYYILLNEYIAYGTCFGLMSKGN